VTRKYIPPKVRALAVGDRVRLDVRAFWPNPQQGLDQDYETIEYEGPLGKFASWYTPGANDEVWAIYVHGKGSDRVEPMRIQTSVRDEGLTGLSIRYRNDPDSQHASGDIGRYGQTEWQDLEGAVKWALARGAKRLVLVGTSMGGSIVLGFLERSPHADLVDAVILDSPATDIGGIIRDGARDTALIPGVLDVGPGLTWTAMTIASSRFDISWSKTDYNSRAGGLDVPMLIWAGRHDDTVPFETIQGFVNNARPGIVQLELSENEQVGHLMSWNLDPDRYDEITRQFIRAHVDAGPGSASGEALAGGRTS
jgi:pimeloyl-ACP methyl ester carboxylesterase